MRPSKRPKHVESDCSKFESDRWVVTLSRLLSPEEMKKVGALIDSVPEKSYDRMGQEFSLPFTIWAVKQIAPDVEVRSWHAEPFNLFVQPLYMPPKIYEITDAISFNEAKTTALKRWREEFPFGVQATVYHVRLAEPRDFKKMQEVKKQEEEAVSASE